MSRPTWDEWGLEVATAIARRADCSRRQVGAVIMRPDHTIISTGYNGGPSRGPSCLAGECPRAQSGVEPGSSYDAGAGTCIALHAEQNALLRASWDEMMSGTLYCTHQPCEGCTRMITGSPLRRVVWPEGEAQISLGKFNIYETRPSKSPTDLDLASYVDPTPKEST